MALPFAYQKSSSAFPSLPSSRAGPSIRPTGSRGVESTPISALPCRQEAPSWPCPVSRANCPSKSEQLSVLLLPHSAAFRKGKQRNATAGSGVP